MEIVGIHNDSSSSLKLLFDSHILPITSLGRCANQKATQIKRAILVKIKGVSYVGIATARGKIKGWKTVSSTSMEVLGWFLVSLVPS